MYVVHVVGTYRHPVGHGFDSRNSTYLDQIKGSTDFGSLPIYMVRNLILGFLQQFRVCSSFLCQLWPLSTCAVNTLVALLTLLHSVQVAEADSLYRWQRLTVCTGGGS